MYIGANPDSTDIKATGTLVKNNIIVMPGGRYVVNIEADCTGTFDNNLYYMLSGSAPFYALDGATLYEGVAAWTNWQTAGYDANGVNGNPQFRSTSDFRTMASGAGINKGVDVGLTTDYLGKPIRGVPDIGAYEFQSVGGGLGMGIIYGF